jgi:hypothetical protein
LRKITKSSVQASDALYSSFDARTTLARRVNAKFARVVAPLARMRNHSHSIDARAPIVL